MELYLDLRLIKTRSILFKAYKNLITLNKKKIKILDICKEAKITRVTFYHHFNNIKDFLISYLNNETESFSIQKNYLSTKNVKHFLFYLIEQIISFWFNNISIIQEVTKRIKSDNKLFFIKQYILCIIRLVNKQLQDLKIFNKNSNLELLSMVIVFGINFSCFYVMNKYNNLTKKSLLKIYKSFIIQICNGK